MIKNIIAANKVHNHLLTTLKNSLFLLICYGNVDKRKFSMTYDWNIQLLANSSKSCR